MYNPYQQQQQMGYNPQQLQQPQQGGFGGMGNQPQFQPQQTGYYNQPQLNLQSQTTGFYPQQPQLNQPQQTGYYNQSSQATGFGQPPQLQNQPTGYIQSQATGFQQPTATGFGGSTGFGSVSVSKNSELKIPNIRLSFITAADQQKFEDLFRTAVPTGEQALSGDASRDILLRSGLQPVTLAEIWSLSDTNKTGSLLFPEFALALHFCNLSLKGEPLPGIVPEKWMNEVKSFVDAINFSIPEDPSKILQNTPFAPKQEDWISSMQQPPTTSFQPQATGFGGSLSAQRTGPGFPGTSFGGNQPLQQQQQQPSGPLTSQRTGGGTLIPLQPQQTAGLIPAQKTGPLQQQSTGFQPQLPSQNTGGAPLRSQGTGFNGSIVPQRTGPTGFQTSFQAQPTGSFQAQPTGSFQAQPTGSFQQQQTGLQPQTTGYLQSQPTGKPGQWGFVSMPTGGIPGLNAMEQHFLPSSELSSNNLQNVMGGNLKQNVTWAITKQEKQIYDGIFGAWDPNRKGYVDGDVAINIFGKSGLARPDLESIWTLADGSNRGKLNRDEFAVAMHLVYRRLNGFDLPLRLPPELVPPSSKHIQDSFDSLKQSIKGGKSVSRTNTSNNLSKTDGSRFKNNDDSVGYVSSTRHRSRSYGEPEAAPSSVKSSKDTDLTVEELKKLIREKKILLDAMDASDQDRAISNGRASGKNIEDIERFKRQIKGVQDRLDSSALGKASFDEKKALLSKLDHLTKDVVPSLMSKIYEVNENIAKTKIESFKLKLLKTNPDWKPESSEADIVGTGPNGEVTESDKRKFKSKQLLNQRMAALTGKSFGKGRNEDLDNQLNQTIESTNKDKQDQSGIIKDIANSIKELEDGCVSNLQITNQEEVGASKWEKGEGVTNEVASFIRELASSSQAVKQRAATSNSAPRSTSTHPSQASVSPPSVKSNESYNTPEDRSAYIKAQAEKRMNERLAKLGIKRRGGSSQEAPQPPSQSEPKSPEKIPESVTQPAVQPAEQTVVNPVKEVATEPVSTSRVESDDEEDDEYNNLMKQKQEMEAKDKERRERRKKEKEERLAKLKKEMEDLKNKENDDYSSGEDEPVTSVPTYGPGGQAPVKQEQSIPAVEEKPKSHDNNPFAKMGNGPSSATTSTTTTIGTPELTKQPTGHNTNPFFKPTTAAPTVDAEKVAAQRNSQRGIGAVDDDGWSDSDNNDSDEEDSNRAGAAKLASMLFGGMSQPPQRSTDSSLTTPKEEKQEPVPAPVESPAPPALAEVAPSQDPEQETDEDDDFADAEQGPSIIETAGQQAPPIPVEAPPIPTQAPPIPEAPPIPTQTPPVAPPMPPSDVPPPPPMPPSDVPPPPPMPPSNAPIPPPMPAGAPPPAPAIIGEANGSAALPQPTPNINALLGQIRGGAALKRVDLSEQRIADGPSAGRVL